MKIGIIFIFSMWFFGFIGTAQDTLYMSERLIIKKLTENTFVHISYLKTDDFGKVSCNGLIASVADEVVVFDTPTTDSASVELIDWLQNELKLTTRSVIVTHSHEDCLGGLNAFHQAGIPSYANNLTIEFAKNAGSAIPTNGFQEQLVDRIANDSIIHFFPGQGHTKDNIVSFLPGESVLFGGCLIKSLNAGVGYVAEGNVDEWPATIQRIKDQFPKIDFVVPGHGEPGGVELLDYTIRLFEKPDR